MNGFTSSQLFAPRVVQEPVLRFLDLQGLWINASDPEIISCLVIDLPGLVNVYKKLWKDPPCSASMGKSAISTGPCSIAVKNYQRVTPPYIQKNIFSINHDLKHTYKGILFIAYLVGG